MSWSASSLTYDGVGSLMHMPTKGDEIENRLQKMCQDSNDMLKKVPIAVIWNYIEPDEKRIKVPYVGLKKVYP